ncbi:glycosyltransferase family 4 protein [Paenibacillus sp. JX-17]|uniref:Glycosyltransferase family 4 protein n=1 Tax=Paenibacillus lacisoli TaxID=3064525 RepID=A0ABT9CHB1_9BACL|nr:glycosyltransferase family 4 protein [Paenibacillus sp. JX-17]MDO7906988.1 glycosyltransferase family 4 protein [Paenibacillus sp. JX-17]
MARRAKILLFCHVSNTRSITGAEKLLLHFCRELGKYFDCVLIAPNEGKMTAMARRHGIQVRLLSSPMLHGMCSPYQGLERDAEQLRQHPSFAKMVDLVCNEQPDALLTNTCVNVLPALVGKHLGIPVIWKVTEIVASSPFTSIGAGIIDAYSDWVIGISDAVMEPLKQGSIPSKFSILPPSWNAELPEPYRWPEMRSLKREELGFRRSRLCIGYISSFIYEGKGLKYFIQMALRLCDTHPRCRYWIIGSPADRKYYNDCVDMIKSSRYAKRFVFTPFVDPVASAYLAMDIVVVPSMVPEGFGMTALEGLLFSKPVVAFRQGGLAELMENVNNGELLVEAGDSQGLANRVAVLLDHPEQTRDRGIHCHLEARRIYGIEAYREKMHAMVTQWIRQYPSWFPMIKQPGGPVYVWDQGELRRMEVEDPAQKLVREFPPTVLHSLPLSTQPPLNQGAALELAAAPSPPAVPAAAGSGKKRRRRKVTKRKRSTGAKRRVKRRGLRRAGRQIAVGQRRRRVTLTARRAKKRQLRNRAATR